jgi:ribose-phosphate pyrophosphokinase
VLTLDLHAGQIQGFFDIPTDNLYAVPVMARDIRARHKDLSSVMVVSPDVGGVVRARSLSKRLDDAPLAIVDKRRERAGESEVMNVIGDIDGKDCFLIDDIIDSGGTLCNAADALLSKGRKKRHRLYHPRRSFRRRRQPHHGLASLTELVITDSIQPTPSVESAPNIRVISITDLIGEAIARTAHEQSVSSLFD